MTELHDIELEVKLLGILMVDPTAMLEINGILRPQDFYTQKHQDIYSCCMELFKRKSEIDFMTVHSISQNMSMQLDRLELMQMCSTVASTALAKNYAYLLKTAAKRRELLAFGMSVQRMAQDASNEAFLEQAQKDLNDILLNMPTGIKTYDQIIEDAAQAIRDAGLKGIPPGNKTGLQSFDLATNGWQKQDLIIIAARPGMGKTAFAMQASRYGAKSARKVGVMSLEMSSEQLATRFFSDEMNVGSQRLKSGDLSPREWEELDLATDRLLEHPMYINDKAGMSIYDIEATARKWKHEKGLDELYIDYLQLVTVEYARGHSGNREQEVSLISRRLKQLAKELDIPVIALSQLSRAVENRSDKRPMLSDLRESGAIEQDADMVIFLYRDAYYNNDSADEKAEIIIAKYRNGKPCTVECGYNGKRFRFYSPESPMEQAVSRPIKPQPWEK